MKTLRKRILAFALVIATLLSMSVPTFAATTTSNYGALLDSYAANGKTFTLTADSRLFVVADSEPSGDLLQTVQLASREFAAKGYPGQTALDIVWGTKDLAEAGDIVVVLDTASGIATEGYELEVGETATITASDVDGLLYGANSLMKIFQINGGCTAVAGFTAADAPDTKERTVMLDTGRKYYTVEWVKNFIRQMSWMGYNTIELHFSEDGGFRADFWDPTYYKGEFQPENDFSWLCGSHVQSWVKDPYRDDPDAGKYLTTEEMIDIINTAKEYHIDVIPSFDSPAHMDYITWKFEQHYKSNPSYYFSYNGLDYFASSTSGCINYTGKTGSSSPVWPYYTTIDITDGTMAKAFVFALYEDIADFFKEYAGSTDFSIGADEVNLSSGYGIKWSYSQFPGYVNELNRMLNDKGYTCRMFNDFIGSTTYNKTGSGSNAKAAYDFDDNIEIMYWNSDFNPTAGTWSESVWHVKFFWENNTGTTDNWGDGGRILYNCIQTNCYYVLRVTPSSPYIDARNPENRNWTFYHSTEEHIYNEWYPADISEKGDKTENAADVPADQLGGAYFLIWNDYADLNTEAEVWNDVEDDTAGYVYSLFDRMHSNIIKMWNSDINDSVTYSNFASVRETFGYFPGFTSCSAEASLPTAGEIFPAKADNSALVEALADKISNDDQLYTADSYAAYEAVYAEAESVAANVSATKAEIEAAVGALADAKAALKVNDLTVYYKLEADSTELKAVETKTPDETGAYTVALEEITEYQIVRVDGAVFTANEAGTAGTLTGNIKNGATVVTVWYEKMPPSLDALEAALESAIAEQGTYTDESWAAYVTAVANAEAAYNNPDAYTQEQIDALVAALAKAEDNLVDLTAADKIVSVKKMISTTKLGKLIGLRVYTTAHVDSITIKLDGVEQTISKSTYGKVTLPDNTVGKLWTVRFKSTVKGTITYTVQANGDTEEIDITVK